MKFTFEKERFLTHKGRENISVNSLSGSHPIYVMYAKENKDTNSFDILHFDWVMKSRVRPLTVKEATNDIQRYNTQHVFKHELSLKIRENTTHIITGHYDLLQNKWMETSVTQVEGELTPEFVAKEMVNNYIYCMQVFYDSKELYLQNMKYIVDNHISSFLMHKDLQDKLSIREVFDTIINWYQNLKEEVAKNTTESNFVIAPISQFVKMFEEKGIPDKDHKGVGNLWNLFGCLRAHDIVEYAVMELDTEKIYGPNDYGKIDIEKIEKEPEKFFQIIILNERFINIF